MIKYKISAIVPMRHSSERVVGKNYRDFAVTYDDWEYVKIEKRKIKDKIKKLYEIQENEKINKSKDVNDWQDHYNKDMKIKVYQLYKTDFDMLKY